MIKYLLKLKNRNLILSGVAIGLFGCLWIGLNPKYTTVNFWNILVLLIVLIPAFFTCDTFSREYENKSESFIFTTATPVYKQFLQRFLMSWLLGEIIILVVFITVFFAGVETNFLRYFSLLAASTFMALISVLIGNITKNSMVSYGILIVIAIGQFSIPLSIQEDYIYIAPFFNLVLKEDILWGNVISISILSIILFLVNIWYVSKYEKIRKIVNFISGIIFIVVIISSAGYIYYEKKADAQSFSILRTNKDRLVIVNTNNVYIKDYLKSINLNYIEKEQLDSSELNHKNIVVITDSGSKLGNSIKSLYGDVVNWKLDEKQLRINNLALQNVISYRVLINNKDGKEGKIVFIEGNHIDVDSLKLLMNEKSGNFLALSNSEKIAKSKFAINEVNSFNKDLKIIDKGDYILQYGTRSRVIYRDFPYDKISKLTFLWDTVIQSMDKNFSKDEYNYPADMYLYKKGDKPNKELGILSQEIKNIRDFETPKFFVDKNFVRIFTKDILNEYILNNVEDTYLKDGWVEYIYQKKIAKHIGEKLKNKNKDYATLLIELADSYNKDFQEQTKSIYGNEGFIAANMLFELDKKNQLYKFIKEIKLYEGKMDNEKLKNLYIKYIDGDICEKYFNEFESEKRNTLRYMENNNVK